MIQREFTEDDICSLLFEGAIYDDDGQILYEVLDTELVDFDTDKGSVTRRFVINEYSTNRFFAANLTDSPWYGQLQANTKMLWVEVAPVRVMVTKYENF